MTCGMGRLGVGGVRVVGPRLSRADLDDRISATASANGPVQWRVPGVPGAVPGESLPIDRVTAEESQSLADKLEHGKGFTLIRSIPVNDLTEEGRAVIYLGASAHIGHAIMQSSSGLRSVLWGCRAAPCGPRWHAGRPRAAGRHTTKLATMLSAATGSSW